MEVYLYNSTVCRLCGEENDNGNLLYSNEENNLHLSEVINTYLPIKVSDDGHLPRTICPGCTIQLEATVEFLNLIINGQKILRELHQREKEYKKSIGTAKESKIITEKIIYEINTSNGVYQIEHPIALQVDGLEKPKRKRGRPPKKPKSPEELINIEPIEEKEVKTKNQVNENDEPTGKRQRKAPTRFKEVVQGKELERIFKEEGMTDGEESDNENIKVVTDETSKVCNSKEPEVIGHVEKSGELVVVTKGKGRGRPKGRSRQNREQCMICGMLFWSIGRYMSHIAQHGPVLYQCTQCGETFSTRLQYCEHQAETKHVGQNILQCKDVTPVDSLSSKSALKSGKGKYKVDENTKKPNNQAAEDNLISNVKLTEVLPKDLPNLNMNEDVNEENEKDNEIDSINKIKMSDESKDNNDSLSKTDDKDGEKDKIKCNYCEKVFRSRQSKSLHTRTVHLGEKPYKCTECDAAFGYPRSLTLHAISHRRRRAAIRGYACDLCGKVLSHPSSVVYHKQAAHEGQRYVCGTCGKHFRHKQLLRRHQLVHSQLRPFHCKSCNATFKTKTNLVNHQLLHSGVKKFSCEICKHRFAHKTSLTLHMRWHTGHKPYSCNMCGKSFSQKGNLLEHERIHTGEKPYQCTWCPRRFTTSSQHRLHARRHLAERPPCGHCTGRLTSRGGWSSAVRREAGGRLRCTVCGRAFVERTAQSRPARRHAQQPDKPAKQVSLLVQGNQQPPAEEVVKAEVQTAEETEEGVIYITYNVEESPPSLHILGREQTVEYDDTKILSTRELCSGPSLLMPSEGLEQLELQQLAGPAQVEEVELGLEDVVRQHLPVTDEHGNPLHFSMQDGTQLPITSVDGKSLQVITEDGQTIPVEINGYTDDEVDGQDTVVHQLNLQKSVDGTGSSAFNQYYTLV